jgi:putative oxidoreductase
MARYRQHALALTRLVASGVFLAVGSSHFSGSARELSDFRRWGVPWPDVSPYLIGTLEVSCGLLLLVGLLARPAALALAGDMVGALVTAGRVDGGIQLVVPPLLAIACLAIVRFGGGSFLASRLLADRR